MEHISNDHLVSPSRTFPSIISKLRMNQLENQRAEIANMVRIFVAMAREWYLQRPACLWAMGSIFLEEVHSCRLPVMRDRLLRPPFNQELDNTDLPSVHGTSKK